MKPIKLLLIFLDFFDSHITMVSSYAPVFHRRISVKIMERNLIFYLFTTSFLLSHFKFQNMKKILSAVLILASTGAFCQTKSFDKAVITTTINVIAPEDENVENLGQEPRGGMNFRNMMDGETKSVTYLKGDLVKTTMKSDMGRSTIYRDNAKKLTTMIMEMMGNKNGFYATDEDMANMQKRRDSMIAERRKADTNASRRMPPVEKNQGTTEISVTGETKKIAGYDCKKAIIKSKDEKGEEVQFTSQVMSVVEICLLE